MTEALERRLDQVERDAAAVRAAQSQHEAVCAERYHRLIDGQDRLNSDVTRNGGRLETIAEKMDEIAQTAAERRGTDAVLHRIGAAVAALGAGSIGALIAHFWPSRP